MPNQNDPAHKGEAVDCIRGGCNDGYITGALRAEVLMSRYHLNPSRALVVAALAWGGDRHG